MKHTLWWKAALIRAIKTMAQTAVALIGTQAAGILDVDWIAVLSASALAGVLSMLTSVAGLPEVEVEPSEFEKALAENNIPIMDEDHIDGIGGSYSPRLKAPSATDKNWIHTSKGGYNSCILISGNSVLPNCVGYAWGRWRELIGKTPKLSRGNAENWWSYGDGYKRGQTPKLGAVACWRKGKAEYEGDGAGHVAIVEGIDADGTVTIGQSGYGYKRFYITKFKKGKMNLGGTYHFQGFIYLPDTDSKTETKPKTSTKRYKVIEKSGMKIRDKASTKGKQIGTLSYGATFLSSKQSGNWAYIDSKKGWVCIKAGNETYLKAIK